LKLKIGICTLAVVNYFVKVEITDHGYFSLGNVQPNGTNGEKAKTTFKRVVEISQTQRKRQPFPELNINCCLRKITFKLNKT